MNDMEAAVAPAPATTGDRRRFAAALVLVLAWIAFLIGLAATDAQRPMERPGSVSEPEAPAEG